MKKYGKYETRPEVVPAKQPKMKSALLQTYFTSLLCMVLCVTMFFGTSFAWFTSEVENTGNEISVGILKVGLYKGQSAGDVNLAEEGKKLFDGNIRWEPGYTSLETIKVVNEGDLAFKYDLFFTDGEIQKGNQSLETVAQYFDVWVFSYYNKTYTKPTSYADITAQDSGWENVGTLADLLNGKAVLKDKNMSTVRRDDSDTDEDVANGTPDGVKTVDTYTVALHMKENADEKLMGHKISLNVKLVAYQMSSETDSFGDSKYDDNIQYVSTEKELKNVLTNATGDVMLTTNIEIKKLADALTMADTAVLDGNGKTVSYSGGRNASGGSVGVLTTSGGTVKNLTVDGKADGRALYITKLTSNLFVSNCTFSGAYAFNLNSAEKTDYTINFTNTTFASWTSYANVMKCAYFTGCEFKAELKPYGNTELKNCVFSAEKLDVSSLAEGTSVTLTNCTYNGVLIDSAVVTATSTDSALLKIDNGKVVLAASNQN